MGIYKVGDMVVLTSGEYSDYGFRAVVKVLKEYCSAQLAPAFYQNLRDKGYKDPEETYGEWTDPEGQTVWNYDLSGKFDAWFINESGFVEEVEHHEMHTGSYGNMRIDHGQ